MLTSEFFLDFSHDTLFSKSIFTAKSRYIWFLPNCLPAVTLPVYILNTSFLQTLTKMRYYYIWKVFHHWQLTKYVYCFNFIFYTLLLVWTLFIYISHFSTVCSYFLIFKKLKIYKGPIHSLSQFPIFSSFAHTHQIMFRIFCYTVLYFIYFMNIFTQIYSSLHLLLLLVQTHLERHPSRLY